MAYTPLFCLNHFLVSASKVRAKSKSSNLKIIFVLLAIFGLCFLSVELKADVDLAKGSVSYHSKNFTSPIEIKNEHLELNSDSKYCPGFLEDDASVQSINSPSMPFQHGYRSVSITLKNNGSNSLDSTLINWMVNDSIKPVYNWTGLLEPDSSILIELGYFDFDLAVAHKIKAWTSMPNGNIDNQVLNDTSQVTGLYASLSGHYTVGGANPYFETLGEAVDALNLGGVTDEVRFKLRAGIYDEQIEIMNFAGSDCLIPVIFQSESFDSTAVTIRFNANSVSNYTVKLDGAEGIVFSNLTLQAENPNYGRVVSMQNGTNCNRFQNCLIIGVPNSSISNRFYLISSFDSNDDNYLFRSCTFENGSAGLYLRGDNSSVSDTNTVIDFCNFTNNSLYGAYLLYQKKVNFSNNKVISNSVSGSFRGIHLQKIVEGFEISNNLINLEAGTGIYLRFADCDSTNEGNVFNNFISVGGTGTAQGIHFDFGSHINFFHNNINIFGTHAISGRAFYKERANNNISILNNIFANSGGGYSFYYIDTLGILASNYNNLYTTGSTLGYLNGEKEDLLSVQIASDFENNSKTLNPLYYSDTDLHVNKALLNNAGVTIESVALDLDGEPRSTPPDIGADEFIPFGVNVGLTRLLNPQAPFTSGSQEIKVVIINSGAESLNGCQIEWTVDNVAMPSYTWAGHLNTNQSDTINLGNFTFATFSNYTIKSWVSNPNSVADIDPSDDTLIVKNIIPALNGNYTIGGTNPDFAFPSDAVFALNNAGVSGAVIFDIRSGLYNEQLHIKDYPGSDCNSSVVFRSQTGDSSDVQITYLANLDSNYTVFLDGADGVTIKDITLKAEHSEYAHVLRIENGADCNSILNNHFIGSPSPAVTDPAELINSGYDSEFGDYNLIANNLLEYGLHAISLSPLSAENKSVGTQIINNICSNNYYSGISFIYQDSIVVANNIVSPSNSAKNGIQVFDSEFVVRNNKINLNNGGTGIFVYDFSISLGGEITNNFISVGGTQKGIGIDIDQLDHINLYYNSVNINNTNSQSLALNIRTARNLKSFNNILSNQGGNYAIRLHSVPSSTISDHNAFYTAGPDLIYANGYILSLSEFQSQMELDSSSVFIEPAFVSETDLHLSDFSLDRKGVPVPEVTLDIDGQNRDLGFPDIGADEFDSPDTDAGVTGFENPKKPFSAGLQEIDVLLFNFGEDVLLNVDIEWSINGISQPAYNWIGNLGTSDTISVNVGNYMFESDSVYDIRANTSLPNGVVDQSFINDTFELTGLYPALNGAYTIGGVMPDFPTIREAISALNIKGMTGRVTFNIRDGIYEEQLELVEVLGASSTNYIIFQSESQDSSMAIITYSSTHVNKNYTLYLNGIDYVTFQNLTIEASNSALGGVVNIDNGATYVTLSNNHLKGVTAEGLNFLTDIIASPNGNDHYLSIMNNRIENGHEAIKLFGESNSSLESGVLVSGNIISNPNWEGINLQYLSEPKVIGNSISNSLPFSTRTGILFKNIEGSFQVEQNSITLKAGTGIALDNCNSTLGSQSVIANNFISIGDEYTSRGIKCSQSTFQNFYYNSINMFGSLGHSTRAVNLISSSDITLENNIFANNVGGIVIWLESGSAIKYSNHNNLYTSGATLVKSNGTFISNLSSWTAATGNGMNSLSVEVCFNSLSDLHTGNSYLESAGIPIPGILYDFDGEVRNNLTPDIGADEFTCLTNLTLENETLRGDHTFRSSTQIVLNNVILDGNITLMTPSLILSNNSTLQEGTMLHYIEKNGCN